MYSSSIVFIQHMKAKKPRANMKSSKKKNIGFCGALQPTEVNMLIILSETKRIKRLKSTAALNFHFSIYPFHFERRKDDEKTHANDYIRNETKTNCHVSYSNPLLIQCTKLKERLVQRKSIRLKICDQ